MFDFSGKTFVLEQLAKLKVLRQHGKPYSFFTTVLADEVDKQLEAEAEDRAKAERLADRRRYLQSAKGSGKGSGLLSDQVLLFQGDKEDA